MEKLIRKINHHFSVVEERHNVTVACLAMAVVLCLCAVIYVHPQTTLRFFGHDYAILSQHVFNLDEAHHLRYRILIPFIAHVLNIPYNWFLVIPWVFHFVFIFILLSFFRKQGFSPATSTGITALVTFSATTFIPLISPGYTDPASFLFMFLCFVSIHKPLLFGTFFFFGVFNHENIIFYWPAMMALAWLKTSKPNLLKLVLATVIAIAPYGLYRYYVMINSEVLLDVEYYFSAENLKTNLSRLKGLIPLGTFYAFKLFWFFPVYFLYRKFKERKASETLPVLFVIAGTLLQLVIAFDITRLVAFGFMAILLSAIGVREYWGEEKFTRFLFVLIVFNLLVPQYFISDSAAHPLFPLFLHNVLGR